MSDAPQPARPSVDPPGRAPAGADGDWVPRVTDAIVEAIGNVRRKIVGPADSVARGVVYGIVAGLVGIVVLTLFIIGAVRLLDIVIPGNVWVVYLLLGSIFVVAGFVVWSRRPTLPSPDPSS